MVGSVGFQQRLFFTCYFIFGSNVKKKKNGGLTLLSFDYNEQQLDLIFGLEFKLKFGKTVVISL